MMRMKRTGGLRQTVVELERDAASGSATNGDVEEAVHPVRST